ncbi:SDR family oxidoreductase [Stappia sp. F7233]|uniref:SDR family oxidoreductase n=1 Tax=Stappia albiluteola TaxID=2758565 RepID=A0A839AC48_9HYPH|nr:SDR family oxidoreductase [Stappia albiluteola]MBA5777213.1 SDR family oxidoreductase [Stappia albiluteola]
MAGKGSVALVTGASSGIGKAVAISFLKAGYKTVLVGRRAELLQEAVQDAGALAEDALCVPADVTDPDQVDELFKRIGERFGRLDVVFNNAGISGQAAPVGDVTFENWRQVLSVNLDGAFLIARGAFRMMREQSPQGGRIINNGSISAYVPRPGSVAYTASKHAITGLTRTISLDGRPFDIACGQIDIGNTASDMTEKMAKGVPQADGSVRAEPVMDVSNVANAVLHMASLPLEANVQFMTVMATKMPFIGRG